MFKISKKIPQKIFGEEKEKKTAIDEFMGCNLGIWN